MQDSVQEGQPRRAATTIPGSAPGAPRALTPLLRALRRTPNAAGRAPAYGPTSPWRGATDLELRGTAVGEKGEHRTLPAAASPKTR